MPTPKEELVQGIDRARATGRVAVIDPAMSRSRIADLESRCGGPLPPEILELIEYASGFSIDGVEVHFGGDEPFEFESVFPCPIAIATDGGGNFWVVDVTSYGWGAVFFVAHDPPVIVISAPDIAAFIHEVFRAHEPIKMAEPLVEEIAKSNPNVISYGVAVASTDAALRDFARDVGAGFVVVDLRRRAPGYGFIWGLAGPNTEVRRAGSELLFAVEKKKPGMLERLFSR